MKNHKVIHTKKVFFVLIISLFAMAHVAVDTKESWKIRMDELILKHSSEAKISVSYISFNSLLDQYHRNANTVVQSNDLIKLPVLFCALDMIQMNSLDKDEAFKLREDRLRANTQGMFGEEDVNRFVTTEQLMEAIVAFNDNTATNVLFNRMGKETFEGFLKNHDLNNTYLLKPLDDRTKNEKNGASNFVSVGDMAKLQKRMLSQLLDSKKGRKIIEDYLLNFQNATDNDLRLHWNENTSLAKGSSFMKCDSEGYVICITVSSFQDEALALKLIENAESIFFSQFTSLSSN